ncbi:MAG: response regulator [Desulfobacteraceae bacterium]|nr:response regulator [Desulfobacteraceae bacterium]
MSGKILVVDDEPDILEIISSILTKKGFSVESAPGGREAIERFKSEPFDLVLTDIRMPGTDGFEVMKQVRSMDREAEIIIMTGFPSVDIAVRTLKDYGAFDFLTKPLRSIEQLSITVDQALERRRLRKEKKALIEELTQANKKLKQEIEERKRAEKALEKKTVHLEETNTALKVLLKRRDEDKTEVEEKVLFNVKELIIPYLDKLKKTHLDDRQSTYLDIVETNMNNIVSPFLRGMSSGFLKLTPQEVQVANLVKQGKRTKEIAELLNLSPKTIDTYRDNIRKKIGLKNKKVNLRTYLLSIQ